MGSNYNFHVYACVCVILMVDMPNEYAGHSYPYQNTQHLKKESVINL
jgi:hypothetical protein